MPSQSKNQRKWKERQILWPFQRAGEHAGDGDTNSNRRTRNSHKRLGKGTGGVRNWRTSRDYVNYMMFEIGRNTEKSPGDLWKLVVTETSLKDHELTLVWGTCKTYNNNDMVYDTTYTWLRMGSVKREHQSLLTAAENKAKRTNYFKAKINNTQKDSKCRLCVYRYETVNHVISKFSQLSRKQYTIKYNWMGKVLFTNPSARAGYDTRSIFKRSLTGFEFRVFLLLD